MMTLPIGCRLGLVVHLVVRGGFHMVWLARTAMFLLSFYCCVPNCFFLPFTVLGTPFMPAQPWSYTYWVPSRSAAARAFYDVWQEQLLSRYNCTEKAICNVSKGQRKLQHTTTVGSRYLQTLATQIQLSVLWWKLMWSWIRFTEFISSYRQVVCALLLCLVLCYITTRVF
jgi:hypothetical protein